MRSRSLLLAAVVLLSSSAFAREVVIEELDEGVLALDTDAWFRVPAEKSKVVPPEELSKLGCAAAIGEAPIATFTLVKDAPESFRLAIAGQQVGGFVITGPDGKVAYAACADKAEPEWTQKKAGAWKAGKYQVWAVSAAKTYSRFGFRVTFADPAKKRTWDDHPNRVVIPGKLPKPLYLDVPLQAKRTGSGSAITCKVPFPKHPDLVLDVKTPIRALTIRPLYPSLDVQVRVKRLSEILSPRAGSCGGPSSELAPRGNHVPGEVVEADVGRFITAPPELGVFLGASKAETKSVTLMIFDEDTVIEPYEHPAPADANRPVAERVVGWHFPGYPAKRLISSWPSLTQMKEAGELFANAPKELFVYARADLPEQSIQSRNLILEARIPKDEPLLILEARRDYATVLGADGFYGTVAMAALAPQPSDPSAAKPLLRGPAPGLDFGQLKTFFGKASQLDKELIELDAKGKKCREKVWEKYDPLLAKETWTVKRKDGNDAEIRSPKYDEIADRGIAEADKKCGKMDWDSPQRASLREKAIEKAKALFKKEREALVLQVGPSP